MGRPRPAVGGSHWHSLEPVPSLRSGQREQLCAGIPRRVYSARLLGAKTEIPVQSRNVGIALDDLGSWQEAPWLVPIEMSLMGESLNWSNRHEVDPSRPNQPTRAAILQRQSRFSQAIQRT